LCVERRPRTQLRNAWRERQNYVQKMLECEVVKMKV